MSLNRIFIIILGNFLNGHRTWPHILIITSPLKNVNFIPNNLFRLCLFTWKWYLVSQPMYSLGLIVFLIILYAMSVGFAQEFTSQDMLSVSWDVHLVGAYRVSSSIFYLIVYEFYQEPADYHPFN
uniref:Uncharacterized protein n=1 Tax=Glossina palpalis gambiensis TaxID=67801 RepID=A0A1B0BZD5_9MUSC